MLAGHLFHMKKPARRREDMSRHEQAVRGLTTDTLQAIIANLRHNQNPWAKARRMAALDELEQRNSNK